MCKQKGFDGVEADNVEAYEIENTGFAMTAAEQLTYNEWLAETAHSLGLSIALKNDRNQVSELEPYFDFALDEECFQSEECGKLAPFIDAGKAVFETEYSLETSEFCEQANAAGFMAMKKEPKLTATRTPCWPQAQGDWVGAKGSSGYDLAASEGSSDRATCPTHRHAHERQPLCVGRRPPKPGLWKAPRAPGARRPPTRPDQIEVQLHFSSAYKGNLHLYALDWDSSARRETITVGGQTATLSSNFTQGAWVTFPIDVGAGETLPITVDRTAGSNAVLSGIFLGDAGPAPPPTVETAPEGSWVGAVGAGGYDLAGFDGAVGDLSYVPGGSLSLQQGTRYQWAADTTDKRALQSPDGLMRSAGAYYDPNQIRLQLSFPSGYTGDIHLYAVDWDSTDRRETITVDGQTAVLSSSFHNGAWVSLPISVAAGEVATITVDRTAGANAVLSGIFLGDAGTSRRLRPSKPRPKGAGWAPSGPAAMTWPAWTELPATSPICPKAR